MKVLVIGANNSGKGTLVRLLAEKTGLKTVGCSSILNKEGMDITTGKLLPDNEVMDIMYEFLVNLEEEDFILDGFPRTVTQDVFMNTFLLNPDLVVVLNISEEEVLSRAVGRRICENCSDIYNLNGFKIPKVDGVCDKCGGKLHHRDDDKEEAVKRRYDEYIKKTYPIVANYKLLNGKPIVWEFDATEKAEDIANTVAEYINYMTN